VELHAIRAIEAERLICVGRRARQADCSVREIEGIPVPLEGHEFVRRLAEHGIGASLARHAHRQQSDLGLRPRIHARSERGREELDAEAHAPVRRPGANGLADECLLYGQPRLVGLVVDGHRAAHGDDRVELAPVGERLALVELDPMEVRAALVEDVLEDARRLAGDVLEHERPHARERTRSKR